MDVATSCVGLDVVIPSLPPRSRLYSLKPVGAGTAYVESLTGYSIRLAETHNVDFGRLVVEVITPVINKKYLLSSEGVSFSVRFGATASALNSMGRMARDWVNAIQALTLQENLASLTMLPWADVVSNMGLIRPNCAWCPACFEEWHTNGKTIYEPLLWSLSVITVCPIHQQPLSDTCPFCKRLLQVLSHRSRPGYCSKCKHWLGLASGRGPAKDKLDKDTLGYQMWVAEQLGGMLAAASSLSSPPKGVRGSEVISACVQKVTRGNVAAFERVTGTKNLRVWLRRPHIRPRLNVLLFLCYKAGVPLKDSLTRVNSSYLQDERIQRSSGKVRDGYTCEELAQVEARLRPMLLEAPPPCKAEAARRIGCGPGTLDRYFPELISTLNKRYTAFRKNIFDKDKILVVLSAAQKELPPPSLNEVALRLGCSIAYLKLYFCKECRLVVERHGEYRLKISKLNEIRKQLLRLSKRNPPVTLTACSKSVGCCLSTLRSLCPDLCAEIVEHYNSFRRSSAASRRSDRRRKIIKAIKSLRAQGVKPSRRSIQKLLPDMHLYGREVQGIINELALQC